MLKNYLLITFRNMMKNKLFIFINVFGLAIAIACCVVAYFNFDFNQSFDSYHKNASTVYRVSSMREFQNEVTRFGFVPIALGNAIKENVPEVDEVIRYNPGWVSNFRVKDEMFAADLIFVDTPFFNVFTFEFIEGNGELKDKSQIIISDEFAKKNFGEEPALGKPMTQALDSGKTKEYVVTGVFKRPPSNSSFNAQAYAHIDNSFELSPEADENNWRYRNTLFIQVKDPARLPQIEAQIKPYIENNNKIREDFILREYDVEPFEGMAVRDSYNEVNGTWTRGGSPIAAVVGIGMMGIFVLLIACFNLTNTAIAISSRRLKEIGIRKVMGSSRKHLIFQFIGETMMICLLALILGLVLGEFALIPAFNAMWPELKLEPDYF